jgi:hypothetical protein
MKTKRPNLTCFLLHDSQQPTLPLLRRLPIIKGSELPEQSFQFAICWTKRPQISANAAPIKWLNHPDSVKKIANRSYLTSILKMNQITVSDKHNDAMVKKFIQIPVCNLLALAVMNKGQRLNKQHWRRACDIAVRSVHCLQLDFALVHIQVSVNGSLSVVDVDPAPKLSRELAAMFGKAMIQCIEEKRESAETMKPIVIGADVELLLITPQGKISPASLYVKRHGMVGYDALRLRKSKKLHPILELRPRPATHPNTLFKHLERAFRVARGKVRSKSLSWWAGAMPIGQLPLGGHLHASRCKLDSELLRVLDHYLALPLLLCEAESGRNRRRKYGLLGDFRRQFHGGFEYRPLPSWMVTPELAKAVIALFYVLIRCYRELIPTSEYSLASLQVQAAYYNGNKSVLLSIVKALWNEIEKLSLFARYQSWIEPLRQQSVAMSAWQERVDIRSLWNLHTTSL